MNPQDMITDEEMIEQLNATCATVKSIAASGDKEIHPMLTIYTREKPGASLCPVIIRMDTMPDASQERHKMMFKIGMMCQQVVAPTSNVVMVCMVNECWMATVDPKATRFVRPSRDPKREEIVSVVCQSLDARTAGALYHLRRKKDKTLVLVEMEQYSVPFVAAPDDNTRALRSALLDSLYDGVFAAVK